MERVDQKSLDEERRDPNLNRKRVGLLAQKDFFIARLFGDVLGKDKHRFADDYIEAIEAACQGPTLNEGRAVLVEPRIPFFLQAKLLGRKVDPAVFLIPKHDPQRKPYVAQVALIEMGHLYMRRGLSPERITEQLPDNLRPADAFEGLAASTIMDDVFFHVDGGTFEQRVSITGASKRFQTLCFDRAFGRPRITHAYRDEFDGLVGFLVAFKLLGDASSTHSSR